MIERLLHKLGLWICKHPWWVVATTLAITAVSVALLPSLDVLTARTALYPPDIPVNLRFQEYLDEFGTSSALIVVVDGDPEETGPFAEDLVAELGQETEVVSSVFYKADMEFFAERAFLYLSTDQLERLRDRVVNHKDQIEAFGRIDGLATLLEKFGEADATTGFEENIDLDTARRIVAVGEQLFEEIEAWLDQPDRTEIELIEKLFAEELSGRNMDPEGYLRSHDGKLLFLFIQPTSNSDEYDFISQLVDRSRAAVERTTAAWEAAGKTPPTVGFTGLPANGVEENRAMRRDVIFTAVVAAVLILLIILVGFRSFKRGILVFIPLVLAGLWNLGLTAATIGHLTLLTSGFTAILFGLGVDYGIFVSGRIEEERRKGRSYPEAIAIALSTAGRTLLAAGGTTATAFFVIGTVDFTGFAELGIVAGCGVVLVMAATLLTLPALTALVKPPVRQLKQSAGRTNGFRPPLAFTGAITILALVLAGFSVYFGLQLPIDFGMDGIMPKNSESMHYQQEMASRSDFQPEVVTVMAQDLDEARTLTAKLRALPTVARVESITEVLPPDQERKVAIIREVAPIFDKIIIARKDLRPFTGPEIAEQLEEMTDMVADSQDKAFSGGQKELVVALDKLMTRMETVADKLAESPTATARLKAFEKALFGHLATAAELTRSWGTVGPLAPADLPAGIRDRFVGKTGRFAVYAFPSESVYDLDYLDEFLGQVFEIAPEATGFPTTHQVFSRLIMTGFRQATLYAILVVFLLMFVEFRHIGYALSALLPLSLGGALMFGVMHFLGVALNYANIIAFPLVIGLAVDYGVYITHRLRERRTLHPFATMEKAGKPVIMAALTTVAGIGAIVLGEHQGAASLGEAMIYGIITSLVAAIIVLPSVVAAVKQLGGRTLDTESAEGDSHEKTPTDR